MMPLVTCVCPTTADRPLALMLDSFRRQTYQNRELLIVTDTPEAVRAAFLELTGIDQGHPIFSVITHTPQVVEIVIADKMTLGAKRNHACSMAYGELIAHFDDDDFSAPGRLAEQVEQMQRSGKPVVGYSQMKFSDGQNWYRYIADRNFPLGTSLCYRREWWEKNQFPNMQKGSDTIFVYTAQREGAVDVVPCRDTMYAGIHASNLNKRNYDDKSTFEKLPNSEAIAA